MSRIQRKNNRALCGWHFRPRGREVSRAHERRRLVSIVQLVAYRTAWFVGRDKNNATGGRKKRARHLRRLRRDPACRRLLRDYVHDVFMRYEEARLKRKEHLKRKRKEAA